MIPSQGRILVKDNTTHYGRSRRMDCGDDHKRPIYRTIQDLLRVFLHWFLHIASSVGQEDATSAKTESLSPGFCLWYSPEYQVIPLFTPLSF